MVSLKRMDFIMLILTLIFLIGVILYSGYNHQKVQHKLEETQQEVEDLNKVVEQINQHRQELKAQYEELNGDYNNMLDEQWSLNQQLMKSQEAEDSQQELIDTLEQENQELREEIDRLKQAVSAKKQESDIQQVSYTRPEGDTINMRATYYTAFCNTGCTGETATGIDVSQTIYHPNGLRIIAVDPNVIPLGSIVTVKTPYNTFKAIAADTGGAIKGRKIDILVATKEDAFAKGNVAVEVTVHES